MENRSTLQELDQKHPLWNSDAAPIWVASRFSLRRNLVSLPFSSKISESEKKQVLSLLKPHLTETEAFQNGFSFDPSSLVPQEREWLAEHFLMQDLYPAGLYLINKAGSMLGMIDEEDHLSLHLLERQSKWTGAFEKLSNLETKLAKITPFAFNPQFGYLTSDPTRCGTGLRVQAFLHLPCLIHLEKMQDILENELTDEVQIRGLGEDQGPIGDVMIIQNKFSLGLSEEHILESVHKVATKLTRLETVERETIRSEKNSLILDKISRAYGLLLHSYQSQTPEAFAALSLLKLAIDLQWATGMTDCEINRVFFSCRRGHLSLENNKELSQDQLAICRADYLKTQCKKIELTLP